jgi:soluble lytic murein transglycosylase-like protein
MEVGIPPPADDQVLIRKPSIIDDRVRSAAAQYRGGLGLHVVLAVIWKESNFNTWAIRFEPNYKWLYQPGDFAQRLGLTLTTETVQQKTSWGAMQVMGAVARELGFFGKYLSVLCIPEIGTKYGCLYLNNLLKKYDGDISAVLAAYNGGGGAVKADGQHTNLHAYVVPVLGKAKEFERESKRV